MSASAQLASRGGSATEPAQYLTFRLGGEMFAIGILCIKEIIEYGEVTALPLLPGHVRGVINLRGAAVPVLDLAARLGRQPSTQTRRTCIVIVEIAVEGARRVVGAMVDSVSAVIDIPSTDIEPPPSFGTRLRTEYLLGMGKVSGGFVILLDPDQLLAVDDVPPIEAGAPAVQLPSP